jgi:hypothetical protein
MPLMMTWCKTPGASRRADLGMFSTLCEADGDCQLIYLRVSLNYFFHPAYNSTDQAHLDSVGVDRRIGENIHDDPFRQFSGSLILFPYHFDPRSLFDVFSVCSVHLPIH